MSMVQQEFVAIVEPAGVERDKKKWYSGYLPDVPGCVAIGSSIDQVVQRLEQALSDHLAALEDAHVPRPAPLSRAFTIPAPAR